MEKYDLSFIITVVNTLLILMIFTKLYSVKEPFSLQKMENDLVMLDKAGNVIQYPLKNVYDAINSAKTESKTAAMNYTNSQIATTKTAFEARMRVFVKWALTKGNKDALAGNLWAEMENRVVKGGTYNLSSTNVKDTEACLITNERNLLVGRYNQTMWGPKSAYKENCVKIKLQ